MYKILNTATIIIVVVVLICLCMGTITGLEAIVFVSVLPIYTKLCQISDQLGGE